MAAGGEGKVTLTVKVLEGAKKPHKVNNQASVQVGNDQVFWTNDEENPVPDEPTKTEKKISHDGQETNAALAATREGEAPHGKDYEVYNGVQVGDLITYEIRYENYKSKEATVTIVDALDKNVEFSSATPDGKFVHEDGVVTWTLEGVEAGASGFVTLTVKVLEGAVRIGRVNNQAFVQVDNDSAFWTNNEENPVSEPSKTEMTIAHGETETEATLDNTRVGAAAHGKDVEVYNGVQVGDLISYDIRFMNYQSEAADIVIEDVLDANVGFADAAEPVMDGQDAPVVTTQIDKPETGATGTVKWTIQAVPAGAGGFVTLTVEVLEGAKTAHKVNNQASVKVGNDSAFWTNDEENPVPDEPTKRETDPYPGTGSLGFVKVGDTITYEISYKNYKQIPATVKIVDKLDENVAYSEGGVYDEANHQVTWEIKDVNAGDSGSVTLKVVVLPGALKTEDGPGYVANGGPGATVQVGNDNAFELNEVENPVPEKRETDPYPGTGVLGLVKVGQNVTYEILYKNYKEVPATVTVVDKLDKNVEFVSATSGLGIDGIYDPATHTVTWTLENAHAKTDGTVTLTVKVLPGALKTNGGEGKVVNGGEGATVQVADDPAFELNEVENPVVPGKQEIDPYPGNGVLGPVKVGDDITYELGYRNYKDEPATIIVTDKLDKNVAFVDAGVGVYDAEAHAVTWTIQDVAPDTEDKVTLTVKVLPGALIGDEAPGKVVNDGDTATVKVGNDDAYTLDTVENPLVPGKQEIDPYQGNGVLGGVVPGEQITYEIGYRNYQDGPATIVIKDTLDPHVAFVSAPNGSYDETTHAVTWEIKDVSSLQEGKVTLTVLVLESARESKGGPGKVVNGGDGATVKVGNDKEYTLDTVENPVPEIPSKQEIDPYEGNGVLGAVKVGENITYEITYKNYKSATATVKIVDELDKNVAFVDAGDGQYDAAKHTVTWEIKDVPAKQEGTVTLTVNVLSGAQKSNDGPGKVVNGGKGATVQVGDDPAVELEIVENPVPEEPQKREIEPYVGNGVLGAVKVGDNVTYEISYQNYKTEAADIVITDKLDTHVQFVSASNGGTLANGVVTWTLKAVPAGQVGTVTLTVKVLESALASRQGPAKVVNNGDTATVQVGNDNAFTLQTVENPVPEEPQKREIEPYVGNGVLGAVQVGDNVTYEISYQNYKTEAADVVITDKLDTHVQFVSASNGGALANGVVTWTLKAVPADQVGTVTLTVKVLESALASRQGPAKVVNNGETASVKVGNDNAFTLQTVENPVPEEPQKREIEPYVGNGVLGAVKVGDNVTYEISYQNYKTEAADIVISDKLDTHVTFVSASNGGALANGVVTWTLKAVPAGQVGTVTLTVKVLESALASRQGPAKVVNNGDTATVQVGNDAAYTLQTVENPVPEIPSKREIAPYVGNGVLGAVQVGDNVTYEITYKNYKSEAADIVISDKLDTHVTFVSASNGGALANGVVTWTLKAVPAGQVGTVTLTVKVLESALASKQGPAKVVNNGDTASVKVGNDAAYTLQTVENPVPESPQKREIKPYEGIGKLDKLKVGDHITYEISYQNYKSEAADIVITDKLDSNVKFSKASDDGAYDKDAHTVTWTLKAVPAGQSGTVTLRVKVLEGALESKKGPGKVVNGGDTATVKVGNDKAFTLNAVENPVEEPKTGNPSSNTPSSTSAPKITITGTKIWDDEHDLHGLRPESITVRLLADGVPSDATPVWSDTDTDSWTFTFDDLPTASSSGMTIRYTVEEDPVEGYETEIKGATITNHLIKREPKQYKELAGTKTWNDNDNAAGIRPNVITVRLLRDGKEVAMRTATAASDWKYSFGRMPLDDGYGKTYKYGIVEDRVEGYFPRYNGLDVVNTPLSPKPELPEARYNPGNRKTGTPWPNYGKFTEQMFSDLLMLLNYDTPLFGMLATGDETPVYPYVFGGIGALALAAWLLTERRKRRMAK